MSEPTTYATDREAIVALKEQLYHLHVATLGDMSDYTMGVRYGYGVATALLAGHLAKVQPAATDADSVTKAALLAAMKATAPLSLNERRGAIPPDPNFHMGSCARPTAPPKPAAVGDVELLALGEYPPWARHVAHWIILDSVGHVNVHYYAAMAKRICSALVVFAAPAPSGPTQAVPDGHCTCNDPLALGVVHRDPEDGPCFVHQGPAQAVEVTAAARDVLAERARQRSGEGWTSARDDAYLLGELRNAAACYATTDRDVRGGVPFGWPWAATWWKSTDPRRDLIKAGALILAEIERMDRAAALECQRGGR